MSGGRGLGREIKRGLMVREEEKGEKGDDGDDELKSEWEEERAREC